MGLGIKTRIVQMIEATAFSELIGMRSRWKVLRALGWKGLECSHIKAGCHFNGKNLTVADGCYFNREVIIDAGGQVTIGSHVQFAPRSMVITSTHEIGGPEMRGGKPIWLPVTIGDGCWIGAGAMILPGVTVAPGCVIAAGAVVANDTTPDGMYAGVPARRLRDLPDTAVPLPGHPAPASR